jgi:hypothetical protein
VNIMKTGRPGILTKEEIEKEYMKVAESVLDYFEDEEDKKVILNPVF